MSSKLRELGETSSRDPNRIPQLMARLQRAWQHHPHLRLGQIIDNASHYTFGDDIFTVEDEEFVQEIMRSLREDYGSADTNPA